MYILSKKLTIVFYQNEEAQARNIFSLFITIYRYMQRKRLYTTYHRVYYIIKLKFNNNIIIKHDNITRV